MSQVMFMPKFSRFLRTFVGSSNKRTAVQLATGFSQLAAAGISN